MPDNNAADPDTTAVRFTVGNLRQAAKGGIFAFVDITLEVAGIEFSIQGVQARSKANGQTSVRLPTCQATR